MLITENTWNISELYCPGLMSEEAFSLVSYLKAQLLKENWIEADVGDSCPSLPACQKPKSKHIAVDSTENHKEHI